MSPSAVGFSVSLSLRSLKTCSFSVSAITSAGFSGVLIADFFSSAELIRDSIFRGSVTVMDALSFRLRKPVVGTRSLES